MVSSNGLTVTAVTFDPHTEANSYQIPLPSEQAGEDRERDKKKEGGNEERQKLPFISFNPHSNLHV